MEKVCELLNFNSTAYFSKVFKKFTGMAPGKYDNSLI
ncbi:AraC family transcriptional regulator [Qingrenia yutianensis]|uniref:AraC family transcriptional regulator n=1 Tax=Qingrenia yutianensis TaxID=2763676 RepID=A0A926IU09_9FIRM|nr:AraC family transcriptional regulator [Qingrenia yutianensis]